MKRMIHGIKQQHRDHPVLIYTLLITGIISVVIPAIQFLIDGDGFPPDEAREHVTESLAKVRVLKRQLQDIENQLGAVHDAIDTESSQTLSQDEMGAILQLTAGKRSRFARIFSLAFLYWLITASFFLITGILIQRYRTLSDSNGPHVSASFPGQDSDSPPASPPVLPES